MLHRTYLTLNGGNELLAAPARATHGHLVLEPLALVLVDEHGAVGRKVALHTDVGVCALGIGHRSAAERAVGCDAVAVAGVILGARVRFWLEVF